jgi:pimeloyl-ACP methyl ester carboxylesterase
MFPPPTDRNQESAMNEPADAEIDVTADRGPSADAVGPETLVTGAAEPVGQASETDVAEPAGPTIEAEAEEPSEPTTEAPGVRPRRSWRRRWLRRIAIVFAALFVAGTIFSFSYNFATESRASVPPGLTYVQTGDISTRYREWGSTGTPIVLVHGFIESADTWQYVAPLLAASGHRVYALDLDGWGYTQRVAPFDLTHEATQLLDFLAALHLDRPILVGHSSGAAIVAAATLRAPASVGAVMFLDGDALATGAGQKNALTNLFIQPYRTTLLRLAVRSDALIRTIYSATCGPTCPRLDAAGIEQWRRPLQVPGAEAALWAMVHLGVPGLPTDQVAGLAALPMPKSVVFGGNDSEYSKDSPYQTATRIGAPAPTLIPGAAHLTSVNSPAAVAVAVEALAARVKSPTP